MHAPNNCAPPPVPQSDGPSNMQPPFSLEVSFNHATPRPATPLQLWSCQLIWGGYWFCLLRIINPLRQWAPGADGTAGIVPAGPAPGPRASGLPGSGSHIAMEPHRKCGFCQPPICRSISAEETASHSALAG